MLGNKNPCTVFCINYASFQFLSKRPDTTPPGQVVTSGTECALSCELEQAQNYPLISSYFVLPPGSRTSPVPTMLKRYWKRYIFLFIGLKWRISVVSYVATGISQQKPKWRIVVLLYAECRTEML